MVASFVPVPAFAAIQDEVGEATQQIAGELQGLSTQGLASGDLSAADGEGLTGQAAAVEYVDENGKTHSVTDYQEITKSALDNNNSFREFGQGKTESWYVVKGDVTYNSKRTGAYNNVNFILCDGAKLHLGRGINIYDDAHLKVYAQKDGTGTFECQRNADHFAAIQVWPKGNFTINGGNVSAKTYTDDAAGIGGGYKTGQKTPGNITINGGNVYARSDMNAAAIGGAASGSGGNITINGGTVEAVANDEDGAGIGGGENGPSGNITINGGEVTATGAENGAGIGSGWKGKLESITINGGKVYARGGDDSAGIGSAEDSPNGGTIKITGGTVCAYGGEREQRVEKVALVDDSVTEGDFNKGATGAGIGSGNRSTVKSITITGGTVVGIGANNAAGIGGGKEGRAETITISGGVPSRALAKEVWVKHELKSGGSGRNFGYYYENTFDFELEEQPGKTYVYADGHSRGAGIGSGQNVIIGNPKGGYAKGGEGKSCGTVNIWGGLVDAHGGEYAAGIGGGDESAPTAINIGNGKDQVTVNANSYKYGAGIGSGDCSDSAFTAGPITIKGNGTEVTQRDKQGMPSAWTSSTTVSAVGGEDGCGIGGGDYSAGSSIVIDGAYVTSFGVRRGAGIGGGPNHAFDLIDIKNQSAVIAVSGYGAGIGTGAASLMKDDPTRVIGGDIKITKSTVSAASKMGGAGIGGGVFGHANNIDISASVVTAEGGALFGPGTIGDAFKAKLMLKMGSEVAADTISFTAVDGFLVKWALKPVSLIGDFIGLFGSDPDIIFYTSAGIGGGYKEWSGNITISNNSIIQATAGMLPPDDVLERLFDATGADEILDFQKPNRNEKSSAIGNGGGCTKAPSVKLYDPATVMTTQVDIYLKKGHSVSEIKDMSDPSEMDTKVLANMLDSTMTPNPPATTNGKKGAKAVTENNVAIITPAPPETEPSFRTHSLLLDGSIGVDFYMSLPEMEGVDYANSYMEFTVSGKDGKTTRDNFDPNAKNEDGSYYAFTCYVNSIQMADTITATFHYGDGKTISQEYSVAQYIADFDKLLAQNPKAFDQTTVDLVHALANYGHYAQQYLADLRGWKIGTDHAEMPAYSEFTDDTRSAARDASASYSFTASKNTANSHVTSVAMSLDLLSSTTLYLYASTDGTKDVTSMTLTDGTELTLIKTSDTQWRAEVPNIMAHSLSDVLNVTVTTTGGTTATMEISACSFANTSLHYSSYANNMPRQNAGAALMLYSQAADAYVEKYGDK